MPLGSRIPAPSRVGRHPLLIVHRIQGQTQIRLHLAAFLPPFVLACSLLLPFLLPPLLFTSFLSLW